MISKRFSSSKKASKFSKRVLGMESLENRELLSINPLGYDGADFVVMAENVQTEADTDYTISATKQGDDGITVTVVAPVAPATSIAGTTDLKLYQSTNGTTWTEVTNSEVTVTADGSSADVWAFGGTAWNSGSIALTGLADGTYQFRLGENATTGYQSVAATTGIEIDTSTEPEPTGDPVTNSVGSAGGVTTNAATVAWTKPTSYIKDADTDPVKIKKVGNYTLEYSTDGTTWKKIDGATVKTKTSWVLTGLAAGTGYEFRVTADLELADTAATKVAGAVITTGSFDTADTRDAFDAPVGAPTDLKTAKASAIPTDPAEGTSKVDCLKVTWKAPANYTGGYSVTIEECVAGTNTVNTAVGAYSKTLDIAAGAKAEAYALLSTIGSKRVKVTVVAATGTGSVENVTYYGADPVPSVVLTPNFDTIAATDSTNSATPNGTVNATFKNLTAGQTYTVKLFNKTGDAEIVAAANTSISTTSATYTYGALDVGTYYLVLSGGDLTGTVKSSEFTIALDVSPGFTGTPTITPSAGSANDGSIAVAFANLESGTDYIAALYDSTNTWVKSVAVASDAATLGTLAPGTYSVKLFEGTDTAAAPTGTALDTLADLVVADSTAPVLGAVDNTTSGTLSYTVTNLTNGDSYYLELNNGGTKTYGTVVVAASGTATLTIAAPAGTDVNYVITLFKGTTGDGTDTNTGVTDTLTTVTSEGVVSTEADMTAKADLKAPTQSATDKSASGAVGATSAKVQWTKAADPVKNVDGEIAGYFVYVRDGNKAVIEYAFVDAATTSYTVKAALVAKQSYTVEIFTVTDADEISKSALKVTVKTPDIAPVAGKLDKADIKQTGAAMTLTMPKTNNSDAYDYKYYLQYTSVVDAKGKPDWNTATNEELTAAEVAAKKVAFDEQLNPGTQYFARVITVGTGIEAKGTKDETVVSYGKEAKFKTLDVPVATVSKSGFAMQGDQFGFKFSVMTPNVKASEKTPIFEGTGYTTVFSYELYVADGSAKADKSTGFLAGAEYIDNFDADIKPSEKDAKGKFVASLSNVVTFADLVAAEVAVDGAKTLQFQLKVTYEVWATDAQGKPDHKLDDGTPADKAILDSLGLKDAEYATNYTKAAKISMPKWFA